MSSVPIGFNKPSYVEYGDWRFLIMDAPTDQNAPAYVEECKKHNVKTVVRACEPSYSADKFNKAGITVAEMPFPDGDPPPKEVVGRFLELCDKEFENKDQRSIAVHCVAGLGRAPVLVAIALIEQGLQPIEAIEKIRKKRRGAINVKQISFLEKYKPRKKGGPCVVM